MLQQRHWTLGIIGALVGLYFRIAATIYAMLAFGLLRRGRALQAVGYAITFLPMALMGGIVGVWFTALFFLPLFALALAVLNLTNALNMTTFCIAGAIVGLATLLATLKGLGTGRDLTAAHLLFALVTVPGGTVGGWIFGTTAHARRDEHPVPPGSKPAAAQASSGGPFP